VFRRTGSARLGQARRPLWHGRDSETLHGFGTGDSVDFQFAAAFGLIFQNREKRLATENSVGFKRRRKGKRSVEFFLQSLHAFPASEGILVGITVIPLDEVLFLLFRGLDNSLLFVFIRLGYNFNLLLRESGISDELGKIDGFLRLRIGRVDTGNRGFSSSF